MAFMSKDPIFIAVALIGLVILISGSVSYATMSDIECLKKFKNSVEDPFENLSSWNFHNNTGAYICEFTGIECLHYEENQVASIGLSDMGLKGQFPRGLENCSIMVGLNLSNNNLYGSIPDDIPEIIPFLSSLDLSSNSFSGKIPPSLASCSHLYSLKLNNNRFVGNIPLELGLLNRIKEFNVANNLLTGPVPSFQNVSVTAEDYANNPGLCGKPLLTACLGAQKKSAVRLIAGAAMGGVTSSAVILAILLCYFNRCSVVRKKEVTPMVTNGQKA